MQSTQNAAVFAFAAVDIAAVVSRNYDASCAVNDDVKVN
jgi:hypothetical protein